MRGTEDGQARSSAQLGLVILLLLIFGTELTCGIAVLADSRLNTAVQII